MRTHYFRQPFGYGYVIISLVYLSAERSGITILHAALHSTVYGNGYVHLNMSVGDGIATMGL